MMVRSERDLKAILVEKLRENVPLEDVREWLWEDYGIRAGDWDAVKRAIVSAREVTARDIAVLLVEYGVNVEGEWYE
jgi:hypothetical protein